MKAMNATLVSKASVSLVRGGAQGGRTNHSDDDFLDRTLGVDPRRSGRPFAGSRAGALRTMPLSHRQGSMPAAVSTSGIPLCTHQPVLAWGSETRGPK